jgi:hypothetical protein
MADATLVLLGALAISQASTISVHVRNDVKADADTLATAQSVVSQIYAQAGVSVVWSDDPFALTIVLRPRASQETARRAQNAVGYTPGGGNERGRLAFVMINRVNQVADGYSAARPVVMGAAIAHEPAHLLLGSEHSATGVMKAYFNQADFRKARDGQLFFTAEQAQRLRGRAEALR